MKAHQIISALDEARTGRRRIREDTAPVASSPSHAPTSTAQWKTSGNGSKDEGSHTMGEKNAIKKSDHSLPAPVAKSPSHAPTSTAQWKTKGGYGGNSEDEGEAISKEAMKENLLRKLMNSDEVDINAIMAEAELAEGGHKPGCQCGFCKNKSKFGKKKDGEDMADDDDEKEEGEMSEAHVPVPRHDMPMKRHGMPTGRNLGGDRMNFRHRSAGPRPKAASLPGGVMNPNQPAMERLYASDNPREAVQEAADELLESPDNQ